MEIPPVLIPPDWVLVGAQWGADEVAVFGSVELTEAEIRTHLARLADFDGVRPTARMDVTGYTIRATMSRIAFATGATYGEALARLLQYWDADNPTTFRQPPALDTNTRIANARIRGGAAANGDHEVPPRGQ